MEALLSVQNVSKDFLPRTMTGIGATVRALDGINLNILPGVRLAIVGGSGSGKSTLAACLACLEKPSSGKIYFHGRDVTELSESELRTVRPQIQLVFQDWANAFNPDFTVLQILEEPLLLNSKCNQEERRSRAAQLLQSVGMPSEMLVRKSVELSGGQRQRVGIARALALEPKVLVLDEALSALDSSVQAQIANLLLDLNARATPTGNGLATVLITHDLVMAARLADEIVVMRDGLIVERGSSRRIVTTPEHEATKALVAATMYLAADSGAVT
ncbi:MAG TPA: ATP-binding cassette domain-containing protein [Candidatus Acidoferrum sp.]|nr:ATP-binding cassette domain-containing protein [Candidatus Acidoferrum sp.]